MHPAPAGQGEPVLVYRPGASEPLAGGSEPLAVGGEQLAVGGEQLAGSPSSANRPPPTAISSISTANGPLPTANSSTTPLPEVYAKSAPMLRCSGGQVLHARLDDTSGIHLAFFEWDGTDTGSVLEAFRHMPEACMGSIGMTLVEKAPVRTYVVRDQGTGNSGQEENQKSAINNLSRHSAAATDHQSSISPSSPNPQSPIPNHSLFFDHTVFREGGGHVGLSSPIHAFRAVWVAGISAADARKGLAGNEFDRLRTIRLKSALNRFRPAHARVVQGAVRGIPDPDLAWQAFEQAMLKDLSFVAR